MPLPDEHLETLNRHLAMHREDITALQATLRILDREIKKRRAGEGPPEKRAGLDGLIAYGELVSEEIGKHEDVIKLASDDLALEMLAEFIGNPKLARLAARNPRAYAKERGLELPASMDVDVAVRDGRAWVRIASHDDLTPFTITWTDDGFSAPQTDPVRVG
jgi:hypothetical protein